VPRIGREKNSARRECSNQFWLPAPVLSRGAGCVSMNYSRPGMGTFVCPPPSRAHGTAQNRRGQVTEQIKACSAPSFSPYRITDLLLTVC
jgi:hypothetical protein